MKTNATDSHRIAALLFLFFTSISFSQVLSGVVLDAKSNETIPFATVQIGADYGVITNSEGRFNISTEKFTENDSIKFSFLGYKQTTFAIKDLAQDTIYLSENIDKLDNVYLMNKNIGPDTILTRVNKRIIENYNTSFQKLTVFSRKKQKYHSINNAFKIKKADFVDKKVIANVNKELSNLSKNAANKTSTIYNDDFTEVYVSKNDSLKIDIKKATRLINTSKNTSADVIQSKAIEVIAKSLESSNTFKVRSGLFPLGDSLELKNVFKTTIDTLDIKDKKKSLQRILKANNFMKGTQFDFVTDFEKYDYTIDDMTNFNGETVYVLSFKPRKNSADYAGQIYVSADSYAVLKVVYALAEGKTGTSINLKLLLGFKYKESARSGTVIYQKNSSDKYVPRYIKTQTQRYTYLNRSFTFIENNEDRKDRMKLKMNIDTEADINDLNELLFVNSEAISESEFLNLNERSGVTLEKISKYDPSLWAAYTIISPDTAIKEFEN